MNYAVSEMAHGVVVRFIFCLYCNLTSFPIVWHPSSNNNCTSIGVGVAKKKKAVAHKDTCSCLLELNGGSFSGHRLSLVANCIQQPAQGSWFT